MTNFMAGESFFFKDRQLQTATGSNLTAGQDQRGAINLSGEKRSHSLSEQIVKNRILY